MGLWRLNSSGTWGEVKRVYRLNSSGTWVLLKNIWRLSSSGIWQSIYNSQNNPQAKSPDFPKLYFVDSSNFASEDIAYNTYKMYLTRGKWTQDPDTFLMQIQKSLSSGFSSPINITNQTRTYASYSDSDYNDQVPTNSANRQSISKSDIRDGYYYRGYVKATNDTGLFGEYFTSVVKPRINASLTLVKDINLKVGQNPTSNGATFSWNYSGLETIVAADVYSQIISIYPQGNTAGTPIYSQSVSPGTSTVNPPNSSVIISDPSISSNTTYTVVVTAVMNDLWKTESSSLQTKATDFGDFTTAAAAPAKPIITSATDVGTNRPYNNGAITLQWSQPSGGAAAVGYKIEYSEGPNYLTTVVLVSNTGNTSLSGTFTGLKSNTNYKFYVTAIGANANSLISDASSITLITTVPTEPTGVYAVAGNGQADVYYTFTPSGLNGGKTISYYRATSTPGSITSTEVVSPITITGLTNYTSYTFTVAAYNANGFSAESTASSAVTPQLPLPINNIAPTIASDSSSNYIYKVTYLGSWFNSPTSYDYQWQTSSDGGSTWTTRNSGINVASIPDYNASLYKAQNIRVLVWGRNQTGPSLSSTNSNTLFIFYTTPTINSFTVTGSELLVSWSYSYSTDDPSATVSLEYKLSSASTWTSIALPSSTGQITLSPNTYDFRLTVTNSTNGAFRTTTSTVTNIIVTSLYTFSFGNTLYPNTNGIIGLNTGTIGASVPASGKYLAVFPGDFIGNTSATPGYMLAWSDSTKYVIRFDGYRFGFAGQSAYRLEWMATFYTNQNYIDVKIITKGSSVSGGVTAGLYNNGTLVAGLPGPYTLSQGTTYRLNTDGSTGSFSISYDEISITAPNDIMTTAGTKVGTGDDDVYYSITTSSNYYKSPVVTVNDITANTATSLTIPFTESNGCDYIQYILRSGSHSGSTITSGTIYTSPITISGVGLTAATNYYITVTPYNYKNQAGTSVQHTTITAPPAPTVTWSNVAANSATVSWSATSATSYNVDIYATSSGNRVYGPITVTTTSVNLNSLTTAAQYTASVYGINADGTGATTSVNQYTDAKLFYDGNSNTGGSAPATTEHDYNTNATVAGNTGSLTRTYGTWAGWSLFSDGSGTTYGPGYTTTILMNDSKFLYARWLANVPGTPNVTVSYTPTTTTASANSLWFNPVNFGSDTSSVFLEWGTSTAYGNSTSVTTNGGSYTTPANLAWNTTYFWRARGYNPFYNNYGSPQTGSINIPITQWTVTWDATTNGGTVSPTSSTVNNGSSVTAPSATRSGYTFNGWYNASSGGSLIVSGGGSYTPTASVTLYAQFSLIQIAPNNGSVTISLQSGTAGRVGATYSVTSATASGTPTPTVSAYQWQYFSNATSTWISITGATSSSYTISFGNSTYSDIGRTIRCSVTFTNGVSPDLNTGSNSITVDNPTITNVVSYYYSTASRYGTKANGYPQRPPGTTGSGTISFVVWYVEGYNMQGINSKTVIQGTTQTTTTASDSLNIYSSSGTIGDGSFYSGGIYRNTGAGGNGQTYALRIEPSGLPQGTGAIGQRYVTNTVTNNSTNQTNSPITHSLTAITSL